MPKISNINLKSSALTDKSVTELAHCASLRNLALGGNPGVTDNSMTSLARLPNLRSLTLEDTGVTFSGLCRLRGLKLRHLVLPRSNYTASQMSKLKEYFPEADLVMPRPTVDPETKRMFTTNQALTNVGSDVQVQLVLGIFG